MGVAYTKLATPILGVVTAYFISFFLSHFSILFLQIFSEKN